MASFWMPDLVCLLSVLLELFSNTGNCLLFIAGLESRNRAQGFAPLGCEGYSTHVPDVVCLVDSHLHAAMVCELECGLVSIFLILYGLVDKLFSWPYSNRFHYTSRNERQATPGRRGN